MAAALTDKAHSVSVVGMESVPFKKALGEKVGKAIMKVGVKRQEALVARGFESLIVTCQTNASQPCPAPLPLIYFSLQLFEANRVKFYMMNEVSEMIGHHGQVF